MVWDCTRWLAVRDSFFYASDIGIACVNHDAPVTHAILERNKLDHMFRMGISFGPAAAIDRLVGNLFYAISGGPAATVGHRGVGLVLDDANDAHVYPQVRLARDNEFIGNDVGIELRGRGPATGTLDFGRPGDPGRNVFRCNATHDGSAVAGHDVVVRAPLGRGARLQLAGNVWDHAPPTLGDANGADVDAAPADRRAIELTGASAAPGGCNTLAP